MKIKAALLAMIVVTGSHAASAATDESSVPFHFIRNSIVVGVNISGAGPFEMLFDTGVNPSLVDLNLARKLGLTLSANGEQPSGGGSGTNMAYPTILPKVDLNGLIAENVDCLAADLSKTSVALGIPLQGVLGYSFMKDRVFEIDYARHLLIFHPRSPFSHGTVPQNDARRTFVRFRFQDEILIEGVRVNGNPVTANLDTGSNATFQVTPAAVETLGLRPQVEQADESSSVGINGTTANRSGHVKLITLGAITAVNPKVVFYGRGTGHDNEAWGVRIGNEFLENYIVTIDFKNLIVGFETR